MRFRCKLTRTWCAVAGLLFAGLAYATIVYGYHRAITDESDILMLGIMVWGLALVIMPLALVIVLTELRRAPTARAQSIRQFSFLIAVVLATWSLQLTVSPNRTGWKVYRRGMEAFVERSRPLVAAIKAYEAKTGAPPRNLRDLVPAYLPAIPETGLAHPEYEYAWIAPDRKDNSVPYHESWRLKVRTSTGLMSFDSMNYTTDATNLSPMDPKDLEPIGDWFYFHE